MEYVRMGRSGLKVSQVALGCGFRGMTDRDAMESVINHAIAEGINFIDCSNTYGPQSDDNRAGVVEEVLGGVLARGRRDDLVVTTKVTSRNGPGPNDVGSSRHHIMREIDQSLRRLQTDHVDIYLIHWRDHTTPMDETVEAMTDVVRSGKARYWGVCNYKAWEACRALWLADKAVAPGFITMQNQYSLLHREPELEILPFCGEIGIGLMAFSPLAVGVLSGDLQQGQPAPLGTLWARQSHDEFANAITDTDQKVINALREIAAAHDRDPTAVAVQWVLSHPEVTVAIAGPDTPEQLDRYLAGVDWDLNTQERARLDEVSASAN